MQGGGELPWEVTCRGVVDGIAMVIHMTRHEGRRFAEEAVFVKGYEASNNQWDIQQLKLETLNPALSLRAKMTALAMFVGGFMGLITSAQLDPISAHVERVIDGDAIQVRVEGKSRTVRLIGVDTPETKHPTRAVQYFGREASAFTRRRLKARR